VLILGALTPRKNVTAAIRIFQAASDGDSSWRLTVHNRGRLDRAIKDAARDDPRITVVRSDGDPAGVAELYRSHDCFLWPSKAEGVGLPPMEAMATGMDVVCAYNSGMMDYLDDEWAWPVRCDRMISSDPPGEEFADFPPCYGPAGDYWLVDESHAVAQLRACRAAVRDGRSKGPKAADYIRRQHTIRDQARSILDVVSQYL
jgi:glycosyltransferase involved in cell wall biosynthesis